MNAINVAGLDVEYDAPVLRGIDLSVAPGRVHAVVGLNGAGKTTLLRAILGMVRPQQGRVEVFGYPPTAAPRQVWSCVGYLVDAPFVYTELSGRENIYSAARLHGLPRHEARTAARQAIDHFGIQSEVSKKSSRLSLGNRQRVGLAAAFVHCPQLLVLDEPSIGLDPLAVVTLRRNIHRATADGAAVLVSSHHLDEVARLADDITVIHSGQKIATLEPGGAELERQFFDLVYAKQLEETS